MKLKLDACKTLAEIDLGTLIDEECGDLDATGGNLYLYIDGEEYGSLWFNRNPDGRVEIMLGQYDHEAQQWVGRNPLNHTVTETGTPLLPKEGG